MWKHAAVLGLVLFAPCPGLFSRPSASPIDKETVLKAITIFRRTPTNQQGSLARPIILRYAQESPAVVIVPSALTMPWLESREVHGEAGAVLLTAYLAGDVRAQLDRRKTRDDPVAGTEQVIATYRQMQRSEPRLRIPAVEKLIERQRAGTLASYLGGVPR